jgi:hypothetical protein
MVSEKTEPRDPLLRKATRLKVKGFMFAIPSAIGVMFVTIPLNLDFLTECGLVLCCALFGNGLAYFFTAWDIEREIKKKQKGESAQG